MSEIIDNTSLPIDGIDVQITERCTLSCPFCVNSNGRHATRDAQIEPLLGALNQLYTYNPEYLGIVHITGGEPTVAPDLVLDLLDGLPDHGCRSTKRVVSHGIFSLENRTIAQMLQKLDIIKISYDTTSPEKLVTTRPGAKASDLSIIEHNIATCCQMTPLLVQLRTALSVHNLDELIPIYQKAIEWGVSVFQIKPLINAGRATSHAALQAEFTSIYKAIERLRVFQKTLSKHEQERTSISIQCFVPGESLGFPTKRCAMRQRLYLGVDGSIRLCNFLEGPVFGNYLQPDGLQEALINRLSVEESLFDKYGVPCMCPSARNYEQYDSPHSKEFFPTKCS